MIEVKNIIKCYGDKIAVNDLSFTVNSGEILGFLGPNGAGKSTTMNIITGYISSSSGTVTVDGSEILEDPINTKRKIGYLPEIPPLYNDMTVIKYLEFMFELKRVKLPKDKHISKICEMVRITDVKQRLIKNLSKGYKQRVGLAQALLGDPPVLILDEPTVGLDPKQIIEMRHLIKGLGKKHTIILSSHVLSEVKATCDRIIVINNGKLVADSKTMEFSQKMSNTDVVTVQIEGAQSTVLGILKDIKGITKIVKRGEKSPNVYEYVIHSDKDIDNRRNIFNAMAKAGYPILLMRTEELSLEEAFIKITNGEGDRR